MAKQAQASRGIRNNNPGNIDYSPSTKWQGLADPPTDGRFCRFQSSAWGIRALARVLITYQDKHKLDSVSEIICRWAPPHENDTGAYVRSVAASIGVGPDDPVSVHEHRVMDALAKAIIKHENGQQPYSQAQIDEGLRRAGIVPAMRSVVKDPEITTTTVVAGASTVGAAAEVASKVSEIAWSARPLIDIAAELGPWLLLLLIVLAGGGYLLWRQSHRRATSL